MQLQAKSRLIHHRRHTQGHVGNRRDAAGGRAPGTVYPVLPIVQGGRVPHVDVGINQTRQQHPAADIHPFVIRRHLRSGVQKAGDLLPADQKGPLQYLLRQDNSPPLEGKFSLAVPHADSSLVL